MDRKLLIHSKKGYLLAEFNFQYEKRNDAGGSCIEYGHYQNDEGEYSTYKLMETEIRPQFKKFGSIDEIKTHDIAFAKDQLRGQLKNINEFIFSYEPEEILTRFIIQNHREVIGVINIRSNFLQNMKKLEFISTLSIYHDEKISSDSLEGNYDLIQRIYDERIKYGDLHKVPERQMPPYHGN